MHEGRRAGMRRIVTAAVIVAVAAPTIRGRDSFPLSTYPMYASARGERFGLDTVVGLDAAGRSTRLSLSLIAGVDDPLLAEALVGRAVVTGRAPELCREIAARVAAVGAADRPDRLAVVTETFRLDRWVAGESSSVAAVTHAECPVGS